MQFGGGWGESTGTAWFDGLALSDPDAEKDTEYSEDLLPNPSFEAGDGNDIDGWSTDVYSGTVDEHFRTNEVSYAGDFSAGITTTAEEGADAAWSIVGFQLEEGEEYIFDGHIKTENVEAGGDSDTLSGDGAIVYLFQGDGSVTSDALTGTNDWTEVELQFEATQASANVHLMQGLGGTARGTTWFDDLSLVRILSGDEDPLSDIYQRIADHVETNEGPLASFSASSSTVSVGEEVMFDALGSSSPTGSITSYEWEFGDDAIGTGQSVSHTYENAGSYMVTLTVTDDGGETATTTTTIDVEEDSTALDPSTTLQFDGLSNPAASDSYSEGGWYATVPASLDGEHNPTLRLTEGEEYTVEFTNLDGNPHDFVVQNANGDEINGTGFISEQNATETLTFTATAELATYACTAHPDSMVSDIQIV